MRWAVLVALLCSSAVHALDISQLEPTGYVNDFAGVLDPQSKAMIESYCRDVEASTQAEIAVVLVKSLEGDSIEDAAVRLFEKWKIGKAGTDEGILLLFAMEDRKNRIEVGYGLEPVITDGTAGGILRSIRPLLRQGDYANAIYSAVQQIGQRIAEAKGVSIAGRPIPTRSDEPNPGSIIGGVRMLRFVIAVILALFGGGGRRGGRGGGGGSLLAWMLLNAAMNQRGSRGGWSHGGFGGSGGGGGWGGGGFGGFGGGGSGGGGASGGW